MPPGMGKKIDKGQSNKIKYTSGRIPFGQMIDLGKGHVER